MPQFSTVSREKLQDDVHRALRLWQSSDEDDSPLDYLYFFQRALHQIGNTRQATNEVLHQAIKILEADQLPEAALLRARFLERTPMYLAANRLNLAESTAHRKQRQAIEHLADILYNLEHQARSHYLTALEQHLELPTVTRLIGVDPLLDNLLEILLASEPAWIVSLEGLGGIGKTALANAVLREIALTHQFRQMAWVSAKQQEFLPGVGLHPTSQPTLTVDLLVDILLEQLGADEIRSTLPHQKMAILSRLLKEEPHLVVVDNLETVVDYQAVLPTLRKWVNPSKFLLTSRSSLQAHPDVACFTVPELSQNDVFTLLQYEAELRKLSALANASREQLAQIYGVVGGSPLALKLVAGQTSALPLSQVLENLRQAQGRNTDELYNFIYWQAWQTLFPASRQALLVMPLVQNGTLDRLTVASRLERVELAKAVEQLTALSLLEISGDLEHRRYRIHRLTETFLLTEIIAKWQS